MSPPSFTGIWAYPSAIFPDHEDFMSIDESRGRIITFVVLKGDPVDYAPMRNWYRPESATSITARLRPTDPWRSHEFRLEATHLVWTYGGREHAWRRLAPHEYPDWLESKLAKAHAKMDEMEKATL